MFGKTSTSSDFGTLGHFKSLLNRSNVKKVAKQAVDPNVDFFLTVFKGHMLACACTILGCNTVEDTIQLPLNLQRAPVAQQWAYVSSLSEEIVDKCTLIDISSDVNDTPDRVYNYARILCHYGALLLELKDAWAEGDGDRVFCCWKLMMPHFRGWGRTKYALEALRLQLQVKCLFSPKLAHQAKWDRFVNCKGGEGKNIPTDLYNEHVVKLIKGLITTMGPNLTEKGLQRAARSVSSVYAISKQYDKESGVPVTTTAHSTASDTIDVSKVVSVVLKEKLLEVHPNRHHNSHRNIRLNPIWNLDKEKTLKWIDKKKRQFEKFRYVTNAIDGYDNEESEEEEDENDEYGSEKDGDDWSDSEQVEECIAEYSEGLMDTIFF